MAMLAFLVGLTVTSIFFKETGADVFDEDLDYLA